jgi:methyltransferase-like protein/cyclopropane fatty-acyl-phospholipid synthase-like methyltransferase
MSDTPTPETPSASATHKAYDDVPYESHPFAQTHPSRLAAVATLFGLRPVPPAKCRVLELGCASGGNLLPMAEALPGSEFVGVELSARQAADGQRFIDQTGLKNVAIKHASILDVDESYGKFDYVIAHGVFSWVPTPVQDKILAICAANLTPDGVAYVSYNTYPGWHMRGMIRDMMRYHSGRFPDPQRKVQQARALLDFLAKNVPANSGAYSTYLTAELEHIRKQADFYLLHDHLEEVNDPVFFHQFAARARSAGLRYLGEARVQTMATANFGPEIQKTLKAVAPDQIMAEQYMDFLRNRMFRETLLVPAAAAPNWNVSVGSIAGLHVASGAAPDETAGPAAAPAGPDSVTYKSRSGMGMTTNRPLVKAAMQVLRAAFPATVPLDTLRQEAQKVIGRNPADPMQAAEDNQAVAAALLSAYVGTDMVELHAHPVEFTRAAGEKPVASPVARAQAPRGAAANRRHELVRLGDLDKHLIPLLDGTNDRAALVEKLSAVAARGEMKVQQNGVALSDPKQMASAVRAVIDQALANVARTGVLVG